MRHGISNAQSSVKSSIRVSSSVEFSGDQLSLRQILPSARFTKQGDAKFTSIADDVTRAVPGDLVVYRIGKDDPAKLVANAMSRGVAAILTEQLLPCPVPQCIVGDVELAMASITAARLDRPDRKLLTIGVIGSAGKTTTSLLIATLLRGCGVRAGYQTNLGSHDGVLHTVAPESVPSGAGLVTWMADAADTGCQATVIELSEDDARYGHYDAIEFDLVVVTGATTGNTDFGPSALQCVIERMTDDAVIVAPADDSKAMNVIRESDVRVVTYGVRKSADVTAKIIDQSGGMTTLLVTHDDTSAAMETSLCGGAMAANHAAAIVVGLLLDQPLTDIIESISALRSVPGRGQKLSRYGHASVIIDAAGTPDRAAAAMRTFRSLKSNGRLWCIVAIDGGEEATTLARYGTLIERFADQAILTAQPDAKSSFLSGSHAVLDGVEKCAALRLVADRTRAIRWAMNEAGPNDTILVLTGDRHQTPKTSRTNLQRIEKMIEKEWDRADDASPKPKFKVVG